MKRLVPLVLLSLLILAACDSSSPQDDLQRQVDLMGAVIGVAIHCEFDLGQPHDTCQAYANWVSDNHGNTMYDCYFKEGNKDGAQAYACLLSRNLGLDAYTGQ